MTARRSKPAERPNQNNDSSLFDVMARKRNTTITTPIIIRKRPKNVDCNCAGNSRAKSPKMTPTKPQM
jgi:hypothetical protein